MQTEAWGYQIFHNFKKVKFNCLLKFLKVYCVGQGKTSDSTHELIGLP